LVQENVRIITILLKSDVTTANILQTLPHIMVKKQLAEIWHEEITSLLPY